MKDKKSLCNNSSRKGTNASSETLTCNLKSQILMGKKQQFNFGGTYNCPTHFTSLLRKPLRLWTFCAGVVCPEFRLSVLRSCSQNNPVTSKNVAGQKREPFILRTQGIETCPSKNSFHLLLLELGIPQRLFHSALSMGLYKSGEIKTSSWLLFCKIFLFKIRYKGMDGQSARTRI